MPVSLVPARGMEHEAVSYTGAWVIDQMNRERGMTYYLIRHKATGLFMPQGRRNRGYSHWNPSNVGNVFESGLDVPRLLTTRKSAARCIARWAACPNGHMHHSISYDGEEDYSVDFRDDNRKRDDLEVVEALITEV